MQGLGIGSRKEGRKWNKRRGEKRDVMEGCCEGFSVAILFGVADVFILDCRRDDGGADGPQRLNRSKCFLIAANAKS